MAKQAEINFNRALTILQENLPRIKRRVRLR